MKKLAVVALGILAIWVLVSWVSRLLASDETLIRWMFAAEAAAFNDRHKAGCLEGFAEDYRDETTSLDRDKLGRALVYLFLEERHPETGQFRFQVSIPEDSLEIEIAPEEPSQAHVRCRVEFSRLGTPDPDRGGERSYRRAAVLAVDADLVKVAGDWQIRRTRHKVVEGRRPF